MNAPPPKDMNDGDTRSTAEIEAQIAKDAEAARRQVAARFPGEGGPAEIEEGLATWKQLGIEKKK